MKQKFDYFGRPVTPFARKCDDGSGWIVVTDYSSRWQRVYGLGATRKEAWADAEKAEA